MPVMFKSWGKRYSLPKETEMKKKRKFLGKTAAALIVLFWAIMMVMLVDREMISREPEHTSESVMPLLPEGTDSRQSAMGIYFREVRIGFIETSVHRTAGDTIEVYSRLEASGEGLNLPFMVQVPGLSGVMHLEMTGENRLISCRISIEEPVKLRMIGESLNGGIMLRTYDESGMVSEQEMSFDTAGLPAGFLTPFYSSRKLEVGNSWNISVWDPFTRRVNDVKVVVDSQDVLEYDGRLSDVYILKLQYDSVELQSWVTPDGEVVRQDTLFGFSLRKEPEKN